MGREDGTIMVVQPVLPSKIILNNSELSIIYAAEESLPQGLSLSPLLFNIFVADIAQFPRDKYTKVFQFAVVKNRANVRMAQDKMEQALTVLQNYANA